MKNYLITFALFCFISCTNESDSLDNNLPNQDPIIGVWKPFETVANDGLPDSSFFGECVQKSRLTISKNGTFTRSSIDRNCENDTERSYSGTWLKTGEEKYKFTPSVTLGIGYSELEKETPDRISFDTPDKNKMRIIYEDFYLDGKYWKYFFYHYERIE